LSLASDKILSALGGTPLMKGIPNVPLAAVAGLDGYPVLIRQHNGKRLAFEILLHYPENKTAPESIFQLKDGYRKRLM
jgi:hypothetical protein